MLSSFPGLCPVCACLHIPSLNVFRHWQMTPGWEWDTVTICWELLDWNFEVPEGLRVVNGWSMSSIWHDPLMYFLVVSLKSIFKFTCLWLVPTIPICHSLPFPFLSHLASHTPVLFLPTAHTQWTLRPQNSMCAGTVRRTCFLGISFYHPYLKISGTGCFSFLLDLIYTFFLVTKERWHQTFFSLTLKFIFFLYFGSIWKLISDHLLGMGAVVWEASDTRNIMLVFLITILPYLILVLWLHFIKLLFIGRGIFLAFPLSILQFWTFSKQLLRQRVYSG